MIATLENASDIGMPQVYAWVVRSGVVSDHNGEQLTRADKEYGRRHGLSRSAEQCRKGELVSKQWMSLNGQAHSPHCSPPPQCNLFVQNASLQHAADDYARYPQNARSAQLQKII